MDNFGEVTEEGSLEFKRKLPADRDEVWEYLTDSEKRGEWLASGEMELKPGGKVVLKFKHQDLSKEDDPFPEKFKKMEKGDTLEGEIIEIEKPKILAFSWGGNSEVYFHLKKEEGGTLLTLTHQNLADDRSTILGVAGGWHTHLFILEDKLNDREPEGFWKNYLKNEEEYRKRLYS